MEASTMLAQASRQQPASADDSPEAKMARRYPQPIRVADLIGLPLIDDDNRVFAGIVDVVRTPEGKVRLIASYGRWFGWFGRNVSVPIEVVAIVGRQVASLDMQPGEYKTAPTWSPGRDSSIPRDETIRIALTRR